MRITHTVMHPNAVIPKHTHDQDYTIYPLTDLDVKRVYHKGDKVVRTVNVVARRVSLIVRRRRVPARTSPS